MKPELVTEVISKGPDLSVIGLFFQADPFVKGVMFLLIFASIWCWTIIFNKASLMRKERKLASEFEDIFWSGIDLDELYEESLDNINNAQTKVFIIGMKEFNRVNSKENQI